MSRASTKDVGVVVRDESVTLDGFRLHYRDWGDQANPAVVLLHAFGQNGRTWDTVARGLADRFRVIALDHREFGESEWSPDYHELGLVGDLGGLADALALRTFSAVGFSVSASTACSYALLYPGRVERLMLFEGFTKGDETGDAPWIAAMRSHLGRMRSMPDNFATPAEAAEAFRPFAPYAEETELRRWVRGGLTQRPDGRWGLRLDPAFRIPASQPGRLNAPPDVLRERLAGVTCPMLLLVEEESWMVQPTEEMVKANPLARMVTVPRAGHWIPLDNPYQFIAVVAEFLTTSD